MANDAWLSRFPFNKRLTFVGPSRSSCQNTVSRPRISSTFLPTFSNHCRGRYPDTHFTLFAFSSVHFNRYIVRERQPSFQGSFVNTCLLLIGKISGVWGSLASISSDHAHSPVSPAEGSVGASDRPLSGADSMLDMLLAPPGWRVTCARVSSRESFRFVVKRLWYFSRAWFNRMLVSPCLYLSLAQ